MFAGVAEAAVEIAGFERGDVERREIHAFTGDRRGLKKYELGCFGLVWLFQPKWRQLSECRQFLGR